MKTLKDIFSITLGLCLMSLVLTGIILTALINLPLAYIQSIRARYSKPRTK